jgi:hypothetical protein
MPEIDHLGQRLHRHFKNHIVSRKIANEDVDIGVFLEVADEEVGDF